MKQYKTYKDSGVEWIGEIPEHWRVKKLSYQFNFNTGFTPPTGKNEFYENGEHVWVNISDLNQKFISNSKTKITDLAIEGKEIVPEGSLLYSFKLSVGKMAFATKGIYTNEAIFSIYPNKNINLNYYYYLLDRILIHNANDNIYGAKILNQELIKASNLVVPSKKEQTQIANYLNHKTEQLDSLIAKKEQFISLLQEERTAMINQAVTKGLDPNVPMKDSGIEWLGEIPEHWESIKLKNLIDIRYGLGQPPNQKIDGLPIIRATNVYRGEISEKNLLYVDPEDLPMNRNPLLKENEIIVVRSGAYTGDSALITKKWEGAVTGYDMVITPKKVNPQMLAFALLSTYMLENQLFVERLRAAQPHLNAEELGNTFILFPPIEEQNQIVHWLVKELKKNAEICNKVKQEINLLKEYKTALISEVVTGKVDVREEVLN